MACDLTTGQLIPCREVAGGIKEILICKHSDIAFDTPVSGAVTDITTSTTLYRWELTKNTGSLVQTPSGSVENGTLYFEQVLTAVIPKLSASINAEIHNVLKNRLCVIVKDVNDNYHVMGLKHGVEATGGSIGTGTARADLYGYNLTFTGEELEPAPFAPDLSDSTVVSGLSGTVTISPEY